MSEKFRLDCKIVFQNMFYTKCINVIIDSIGPSINLRSIVNTHKVNNNTCLILTHRGYGCYIFNHLNEEQI